MAMPAGPEIDSWVAELVMGWSKGRTYWHHKGDGMYGVGYLAPGGSDYDFELFSPSTEIADAWRVLSQFEGANLDVTQWSTGGWDVGIGGSSLADGTILRRAFRTTQDEWADTAPLAICHAALAAKLLEHQPAQREAVEA